MTQENELNLLRRTRDGALVLARTIRDLLKVAQLTNDGDLVKTSITDASASAEALIDVLNDGAAL